MTREILISRRTMLSLIGVALPATILAVSEAEAQTPGMERREERREDRQERREDRRDDREERREDRRDERSGTRPRALHPHPLVRKKKLIMAGRSRTTDLW